jgi:hypothetical protein
MSTLKTLVVNIITGIWFFKGGAIATNEDGSAEILTADEQGIYWWHGEGYYLNTKGRETAFSLGRPDMHLDLALVRKGTQGEEPSLVGWELGPRRADRKGELENLGLFFKEVTTRFYETLGGYEGYLGLGSMFAFGAAPELFEEFGYFPGLWVHGQRGSGKTYTLAWLTHVWGYDRLAGNGLRKGSAVGLLCDLENYSNLPVFVDEFWQGKVHEDKEAILRDSFGRLPPVKWTPPGQVQRRINGTPAVAGETTASDAALRSRYVHILVSETRRIKNHLEWMMEKRRLFFVLGRAILERRGEFVRSLRGHLEEWLKCRQLAEMGEREKAVHGIAYAGWMAMAELMETAGQQGHGTTAGLFSAEEKCGFCDWLIEHAKGGAADVSSETNVNVFLQEMLTAFKAEAIPVECFRVESELVAHPPGAPNQVKYVDDEGIVRDGWKSYRLYIDVNQVLSALQIYLVKGRNTMGLRRNDLRDQLSKMPFWIDGGKKGLTKWFGSGSSGGASKAWGFALDSMRDLGRLEISDQQYHEFLSNMAEGDPRRGPFYAIVSVLEKLKRK